MRAQDVVITEPVRTPPIHRGLFAVLTVVAWSLLVWLVLPVLTAALWLAGLMTAYEQAVTRLRQVDGDLLFGITLGAVAGALVLVLWAESQRRRFSGVERRQRIADVRPEIVALDLGASVDVARTMQEGRVVVVALDEDGVPVAARLAALPQQRSTGQEDAPHERSSPGARPALQAPAPGGTPSSF